MPGKRSGSGAGGRMGLGSFGQYPERAVFLEQDWESNALGLLLISSDYYTLTTSNFTKEKQTTQRTHRDFLAERSFASCSL